MPSDWLPCSVLDYLQEVALEADPASRMRSGQPHTDMEIIALSAPNHCAILKRFPVKIDAVSVHICPKGAGHHRRTEYPE